MINLKKQMTDEQWESILLYLMQHPLPNAKAFMDPNHPRGIAFAWSIEEFNQGTYWIYSDYQEITQILNILYKKQKLQQKYIALTKQESIII